MTSMRRAAIDPATPLLMAAIISGFMLYSYWQDLPTWVAILLSILVALIALTGLVQYTNGFRGMGQNALQHQSKTGDSDSSTNQQ